METWARELDAEMEARGVAPSRPALAWAPADAAGHEAVTVAVEREAENTVVRVAGHCAARDTIAESRGHQAVAGAHVPAATHGNHAYEGAGSALRCAVRARRQGWGR